MKTGEQTGHPGTTDDNKKELAKKELTQSERFTQAVMKIFSDNAGELKLTAFQKKLCQHYFIKLDQVLKGLEQKRLAKDENYRDKLAITWANVNMDKLAVDVVAFSGVGLDPTQPNHINLIPYKNTATNKYDIGFIEGYKGKEIKARKYGIEVPDDIIVELIYANDIFKQLKRDVNNRIESYQFEITDNFNRGEVVGGYYYFVYKNKPEKNKLRVFSKADIDKRKPDTASVEFWGGVKDKWEYNASKGKREKNGTETVDGWYEEMALKTIHRAAWNSITIDAVKIDDHYRAVLAKEREPLDMRILKEIKDNSNAGEPIGFEEVKDDLPVQPEVTEPIEVKAEQEPNNEQPNGPGF